MNIFQKVLLHSKMCVFISRCALCHTRTGTPWRVFLFLCVHFGLVWLSVLVLAHFERKPAGFSVVSQISKQPWWKSIGKLDVCLKKHARTKETPENLLCLGNESVH